MDLRLRILHGEHIVVAILGIDPIARRDHRVRGQRGDEVAHYFLLGEAELARSHAIDVQLQRGIIDVLRDIGIAHAGDFANLPGKLERRVVGLGQIIARDLHIDRRRHAHAEHRVDQAAGLEVGGQLRHLLGDALAHHRHILIAADLVLLLQAHLHGGGVHAGVARINRREVRRGTDVGDDHLQIFRLHGLPHDFLQFGDLLLGKADAGAGRQLHVHHELARIGAGEESEIELRIEEEAEDDDAAESQQNQHRRLQHHADDFFVKVAEALEHGIEPGVEAVEQGAAAALRRHGSIRTLFAGFGRVSRFGNPGASCWAA